MPYSLSIAITLKTEMMSEMNGIFKKCLESKSKTVELSEYSVEIISQKKRKENCMKTNST